MDLSILNKDRVLRLHKRYILLDRDGTICVEKEYLKDPNGIQLIPDSLEGLRILQDCGFGLIIVSNQSGVGRGYFTRNEMEAVNNTLLNKLRVGGIEIDGIYCCPHTPDDACSCRKPRTGLVELASNELGFDPTQSIVIGDKAADIRLGAALKAEAYLVLTGYGRAELKSMEKKPKNVVENLYEAALSIKNRFRID